jgi:class 3 adenylate cyclase
MLRRGASSLNHELSATQLLPPHFQFEHERGGKSGSRQFLVRVETDVEPDRVLTTILFTDIAASTERARALGDRLRHGISFPRERRHVRVVKRGELRTRNALGEVTTLREFSA